MKQILVILSLILLSLPELCGQRKNSRIENVRMDVADNSVRIHYNISGGGEDDLHDIKLVFISDAQELYQPYHLDGDLGPGIRAGGEKTIIWNVTEDMNALNKKLSPLVISDQGRTGDGPGNALLSLVIPGLGDYFVANRKDMKFKPVFRTILALGCTSLGTYAALNRQKGEPLYAVSRDQASPRYNPRPDLPTYSAKFYGYGDTRYALFKGDAEVLLATGIAVWFYDIFWVYSKGSVNKKLRLSLKANTLGMGPVPGGAQLSFVYKF